MNICSKRTPLRGPKEDKASEAGNDIQNKQPRCGAHTQIRKHTNPQTHKSANTQIRPPGRTLNHLSSLHVHIFIFPSCKLLTVGHCGGEQTSPQRATCQKHGTDGRTTKDEGIEERQKALSPKRRICRSRVSQRTKCCHFLHVALNTSTREAGLA